jgi:RNA polymerase sigma-70 factor (ECF subfamily)
LSEAFAIALQQWPQEGIPANPRAWLVSTGRFKAIDALRRRARFERSVQAMADDVSSHAAEPEPIDDGAIDDDHLRLIFVCCHPALPLEAQVALTLREVCGLTTEEIARAFLTAPRTVAQRIVRAKAKIRDARIPYEVPEPAHRPERVDAVLRVVYLVFNEGYSASEGSAVTRHGLSSEAIRLGRLLVRLLDEPEAAGLLALMLLHESRRAARTTGTGDLVLLEDQDRARWNRAQIEEGHRLVEAALRSKRYGPYTLQAAIAGVHGRAAAAADTDWGEIVALYDVLTHLAPSPIVALNRAVALAMLEGPAAGLVEIDRLLSQGALDNYHLAHAARADLCRRLGRASDARKSYERALELARQEPERRFLQARLDTLGSGW